MGPSLLRSALIALGIAIALVFFQNCSEGFKLNQVSSSNSELPSSNNVNNPPPAPTPAPAPPVATPTLRETRVYLGTNTGAQGYILNHQNETITKLPFSNVTTGTMGWLNIEPRTGKGIALDINQFGTYTIFNYAGGTGQLSVEQRINQGPTDLHSILVPQANGSYWAYSVSYGAGTVRKHILDSQLRLVAGSEQVITYANGAKTHSSSYDSKRRLLYVANLGLNEIMIYRINPANGNMTFASRAPIADPRTVIYDSDYDKVFLVSESYAGTSSIYSFAVDEIAANDIRLRRVGQVEMPLQGGDLKVNRAKGYAYGTARENGKQSIWAMPLTDTGEMDTARASFFFNVAPQSPRALEISADGEYVFVGYNTRDPINFQVYKLTFDSAKKLVNRRILYEDLVQAGGIFCSTLVSILN